MKNIYKSFCVLMIAVVAVMMVGCGRDDNEFNFMDDRISVVLDHSVSISVIEESIEIDKPISFTTEFFPMLDLEEIIHVNIHATDNVRRQLMSEIVENPVNVNTFRISLRLFLHNPCHHTVLEYVGVLNSLTNVFSASTSGWGHGGE